MLRFLGRRSLQAIPLLLVVSALVFLLIHAAPGGPLAIYLSNPNVRPEDIERLRAELGNLMGDEVLAISGVSGYGLPELETRLLRLVPPHCGGVASNPGSSGHGPLHVGPATGDRVTHQ